MSCIVNDVEFCIVRGTSFSTDVALTTAFSDVIDSPADYTSDLVFREYQDDTATVYLTLSAQANTEGPDAPVQFNFKAMPTDTLALPDMDIVAYCDLVNNVTGDVIRLVNADVRISE